MVRWDSPLFTILWTDEQIPGQEIWEAVTTGSIKPPNSGTQAVRYPISAPAFSPLPFNFPDVNVSGISVRLPRLRQMPYLRWKR